MKVDHRTGLPQIQQQIHSKTRVQTEPVENFRKLPSQGENWSALFAKGAGGQDHGTGGQGDVIIPGLTRIYSNEATTAVYPTQRATTPLSGNLQQTDNVFPRAPQQPTSVEWQQTYGRLPDRKPSYGQAHVGQTTGNQMSRHQHALGQAPVGGVGQTQTYGQIYPGSVAQQQTSHNSQSRQAATVKPKPVTTMDLLDRWNGLKNPK